MLESRVRHHRVSRVVRELFAEQAQPQSLHKGQWKRLEENSSSYRPLAARRSRNETTAESSVLVNVRVSSKDRRNDSLSAKPICLRQERISTARRYKISSFEVRYRTVSVVSSLSSTSRIAR